MSLLNNLAKAAVPLPLIGVNAVANKLSGGRVGYDPTPNFSAQNVITTQAGKILNNSSPTANVPQPEPEYEAPGGGGGDDNDYSNFANALNNFTAANTTGPTAAELALLDQAIGTYEGQLGNVDRQFGIARGNVERQYGTSANELQSSYDQAQNQYGQSTNQNRQQYVTNKNMINDTASAGLRGLLRTLSAYGAGGGSDARYGASVVATDAAKQRSGASETFGQNQQGLDTNWGNYGIEYGNQRKRLDDWKTQQFQSTEQQSLANKQTILQKLAELRAQRAGGNTAGATAALSEASGLQSRIDQLGALNPTYDGRAPVYNAPDIASYTVDPDAQTQMGGNAENSMASPYLQMLLSGGKKKQQQPAYSY